jgi:hypothetical protein
MTPLKWSEGLRRFKKRVRSREIETKKMLRQSLRPRKAKCVKSTFILSRRLVGLFECFRVRDVQGVVVIRQCNTEPRLLLSVG